jgi:hypothetical protein
VQYRLEVFIFTLAALAWGPEVGNSQPNRQQSMPDMSMSTAKQEGAEAMGGAMHSMEATMGMGPHMKMTEPRPARAGDAERARQVVEEARKTAQKYVDYHAALAAEFVIFHPEISQKIYHFVNYEYAMEAADNFNPDHPTVLLYEKHDDNYKLVGVMYTAPRGSSEDQLDQRIPLSIAQWHEHVNDCAPPPDQKSDLLAPHPRFGLMGSIATKEACKAAGGVFHPVVFNWMVHVYPFEKDQANIWSVQRQQGDGN